MSTIARQRVVLGFALAMVIGVFISLFAACSHSERPFDSGKGTGGVGPAASSPSFAIEGSATQPISPGFKAPLNLRLTNPHDVPMSVTGLKVTIQNVSSPNADRAHPCGVRDFAVVQVPDSGKVTVPARATSSLSGLGVPRATLPQVGMLNRPTNQDGCQGASLSLAYTASGTLEK